MKKNTRHAYRHALKYTGLFGGVQTFYVLMSIIRNKFTAIFIGAWGICLVDLYNKTADLIGKTTNFGISFSAVRELSALHQRGGERAIGQYICMIRTWTLLTALLGMLICLAGSPLLSYFTLGSFHTTKGYMLLSPTVAVSTLLAGEMAILKGLKRLKRLAAVSAMGAFFTMLLTIGLYYSMGVHGILPVLLFSTGLLFLLNLYATAQLYPYKIAPLNRKLLRKGKNMITLGAAYILAGIAGSGAELAARSYMIQTSSMKTAGYYAVGFTLIISYARLIFVAMDADYFPRLSGLSDQSPERNFAINRQIDVLVLLMAPFLIAFSLFLPLVIRLLYTAEFLQALPMALAAMCYMFFKAVYAPISYLPLAKGDSFTFLTMEVVYDLFFLLSVIIGFHYGNLWGAGLALSCSNLFDLIAVWWVYGKKYGYKMERNTLKFCILQFLLLLSGLLTAGAASLTWKIVLGTIIFGLSAGYSWKNLKKAGSLTTYYEKIKNKFIKQKK